MHADKLIRCRHGAVTVVNPIGTDCVARGKQGCDICAPSPLTTVFRIWPTNQPDRQEPSQWRYPRVGICMFAFIRRGMRRSDLGKYRLGGIERVGGRARCNDDDEGNFSAT